MMRLKWTRSGTLLFCWTVIGFMNIACAHERRSDATPAETRCNTLIDSDFSTLQDAPTQLTAVKPVKEEGKVPAHCQVDGYVAPQVGFELKLPLEHWNGKFLALGTGGNGGVIAGAACNSPLKRGYACIVSDTGHKGMVSDGLWALNNLPAQVDFGYRAVHVVTLAGKALTDRYYSKAAERSYFMGCSTGGYEALVEAQRFPSDYNGILAGSPDMDEVDLALRLVWNAKQFLDPAGQPILSKPQIQRLHQTVLDTCDQDDAVKDGIVSNPLSCKVDLSRLACAAGTNDSCLNPAQLQAVERIYSGPTNSKDERLSTRGVLPGSELGWTDKLLGFAAGPEVADQLLKYMIYGASPNWTSANFDFDQDYKRVGLGALYNDTNPDLRKFKTAGGKLIAYQGTYDPLEVPGAILDYYETVEKTMGGRARTQNFFRFFLIPGMNHCTGGAGAYAVDYLTYLEAWVEKDKSPDSLIGAHVDESYLASQPVEWNIPDMTPELKIYAAAASLEFPLDPKVPIRFTRPIYPYPRYAKYKGTGDPNEAANFVSQGP